MIIPYRPLCNIIIFECLCKWTVIATYLYSYSLKAQERTVEYLKNIHQYRRKPSIVTESDREQRTDIQTNPLLNCNYVGSLKNKTDNKRLLFLPYYTDTGCPLSSLTFQKFKSIYPMEVKIAVSTIRVVT